MSIEDQIKKSKSKIVRRAFIKRRQLSDGLFETNWQEITDDVIKWGSIKISNDDIKKTSYKFSTVNLKVANDRGVYNDEDNDNSLWFGYAPRQRSLVKLEVGYVHQTLGANGIWTRTETPTNGSNTLQSSFVGVLIGDMPVTEKNEVTLEVRPLTEVFRQFPASGIGGYVGVSGVMAYEWIEFLRDQTDGSGNFVFRPFFGNTSTDWTINTTTVQYFLLDSSGSQLIADKNCWEVVERLAQAEQFIPYATRDGKFVFKSQNDITSTVAYEFHGIGSTDNTYGHTIKSVDKYGRAYSKFYSRVQIQHSEAGTTSANTVVQSTFTVAGDNNAWNYGYKTLLIDNDFLYPTGAASVAQTIHDEVSVIKNEIQFTSVLIPQLDVLDRISITYDSSNFEPSSLWDDSDWENPSDSNPPTTTAVDNFSPVDANTVSTFNFTTVNWRLAFSYTPASTVTITAADVGLFRRPTSNTATGQMQLWIETDDGGGEPSGTTVGAASTSISMGSFLIGQPVITATSDLTQFKFDNVVLTSGSTYHFVFGAPSGSFGDTSSAGLAFHINSLGGKTAYNRISTDGGTSWGSVYNFGGVPLYLYASSGSAIVEDPLIWDKDAGNAISLRDTQFKSLSIEHNLDRLETKITAREV